MKTKIGSLYSPTANENLSTQQIVGALVKKYPGATFCVFRHNSDNSGTRRVDIRRVGTYSPVLVADYCEARWNCKSEIEAAALAAHLEKFIDRNQCEQFDDATI